MKKYTAGLLTLGILFLFSCIIPTVDTTGEDDPNNGGNGGTTGSPDIDIKSSGGAIGSGGAFDFGSVEHGDSFTETFTIFNYGDETLNLTGFPIVQVSGDSPDYYIIENPATTYVSPGGSTTFTVTYEPGGEPTTHRAVMSVSSNDPDEGGYDISLAGIGTLTATALQVEVSYNGTQDIVLNGATDASITVTVVNDFDLPVTNANKTFDIAIDNNFNIAPTNITVGNDGSGSGTGTFTINKSDLYFDEGVTLTFSDPNGEISPVEKPITVEAVLIGSPLDDSAFSGTYTLSSGQYHIPARDLSFPSISVGGDITIGAGTKLAIYPGVTLSMAPGTKILVEGELIVYGTDDRRVKITGGTSWNGIQSGHGSGAAKIFINGAIIDKTSSNPIRVGTGSTTRGGDLILKNSRIKVDGGGTIALWIYYPKSGGTYEIKNNIIISQALEAIEFAGNSDGAITGDVQYNTFFGDQTYAIQVGHPETSSQFTIDNNIFTQYSNGIWLSSNSPYLYLRNNVFNLNVVSGNYLDTSSVNKDVSDNLYIDSSVTDTLVFSWLDTNVFVNPSLGDLQLKEIYETPNNDQIQGIQNTSLLVGSLTNGHENEKGAYGNGGYPPNYNE